MNIGEAFPSKYLSAADLQGRPATVRMGEVTKEILDREEKLILAFQGKKKTMVLNKTNATKIAEIHGQETNDWYDKTIEIYAAEVDFQGRTVDAIRVRAPRTETRPPDRSEARRDPPPREHARDDRREASDGDTMTRTYDRETDERPRDPPPRRAAADMDDDIPF
jgi:hypothetical protein